MCALCAGNIFHSFFVWWNNGKFTFSVCIHWWQQCPQIQIKSFFLFALFFCLVFFYLLFGLFHTDRHPPNKPPTKFVAAKRDARAKTKIDGNKPFKIECWCSISYCSMCFWFSLPKKLKLRFARKLNYPSQKFTAE